MKHTCNFKRFLGWVPLGLGLAMLLAANQLATASPPSGAVVAWGDNAYSETNVPAGLTNAVAVSAGGYFSLALLRTGTVTAWGDDTYGQTNVPAGLTNVAAVSAGGYFALALRGNSTVAAWGDSTYGETNVPAGLTNVTAISAGLYHCLALLSNGTVVAWGDNNYAETNVPAGLTNVVAIAAGGFHSLALLANGTVVAWGNNPYANIAVPSGLTNAVAVAAGAAHCLALLNNGTVVAWGDNTYGETSVPAGLTNVVAIAGGYINSLALQGRGTVAEWGDNTYGETNVPAGLTNVLSLGQNSSGDHSLVIVASGLPPSILTQPVSQTVPVGSNVAFSVAATGTPPLAFQWYLNGTNLAGQTSSSLYLTNVQAANAGGYTLVVSNSFGTVTSSNAALNLTVSSTFAYSGVLETYTVPPGVSAISVTITGAAGGGGGADTHAGGLSSPQLQATANLTVTPSSTLVLSIGAAGVSGTGCANNPGGVGGYSPLAGYAGGNGGAAGPSGCSGSGGGGGAATLIVMPDGGAVIVGGGGGGGGGGNTSIGSNGIASTLVLATNSLTTGGVATSHPSDGGGGGGGGGGAVGGVGGGVMAACDCGAYGGTGGGTWLPTNYLAPAAIWVTNYGVFAGNGSITIASPYVPMPPSINGQPSNVTVAAGGTASFTVLASSATPLSYQWQLNGTNLSNNANLTGAQSNVLTLTGVTLGSAGVYQVIVTNVYGPSSATATLTVRAIPVISWNPAPITYGAALSSNQLDATASVPGSFAYTPASGAILNAGTPSLSVAFTPSPADNTNYLIYLSTTDTVSLAVARAPLTVTASNATRAYGQSNPTFAGLISGLVNGDNITATYACSAVAISPPGAYPIVPSLVDPGSRLGNYSVTTNNGTLTVTAGAPPTLTSVLPGSGYTSGGTAVTLTGSGFELGAGVTFGGQPATSVTVNSGNQITALTPTGSLGAVNVVLSNPDGTSATLTNGYVYLGVPPSVVVQPVSQTIPLGSNVVFTVTASGAAPLSYQWFFNNAGLPGQTNVILNLTNVQPANVGNYEVVVTNAFGVTNSVTVYLHLGTVINFATGQNAAGQIQQSGDALDAHWTLVSGGNAPLDAPNLYVVNSSQADWYGGWLGNGSNSVWIAPNPDNRTGNGNFVIAYSFNLTGANLATAQFAAGEWTIDDSGYVQLNGTTIASLGSGNWGGLTSYVLPVADLVAGTNTLTITSTSSDNNYEGTRLEGILTVQSALGAPIIAQQPQNVSAAFGSSVSLSVVASGTPPLSYQWEINGTNLNNNAQFSGTQSNVLTLANLTLANSGVYQLVVTNSYGATNAFVTLTVVPAAPQISWTNPAAISYGTPLSSNQLNATASVPGRFAYNPTNGVVLNAGNAALSVLFTPNDSVDYASVTDAVSLVVGVVPLSVTASNATRVYGQANPTFTGTIVGLVNGDNISATYSCSAVSFSPPGTYPIVPTLVDPNHRLGNYSLTSTNGTLTVSAGAPPTVTGINPSSGVTNQHTSVTITGTGFELGAGVTVGGQPATAVTVNSGTQITAVTPTGTLGAANVVVNNPDATSATLTNGFTYNGLPPAILTQPTNQLLVLQGGTTAFQVGALYAAGYQWQFNNGNLADNSQFSGTHGATLSLAGVQDANVGNYQVVVTNVYGSVTSALASLSILHTNPPAISSVSATPSILGCVITWQTSVPAYDELLYGLSTNYTGTNALSTTLLTSHSVTLSGLAPNTVYHYEIMVFDAVQNQSGDLTFTTLPDTIPPVANLNPVSSTVCSLPYTFSWTGSDNVTPTTNLVFAYRLDSQGWSAFGLATAVAVSQLADGQHTFSVEARDAAGNISSPASGSFYLDTAAPVISGLVDAPSDETCVITWRTPEPTVASVSYGLTTSYGQTASSSTLATTHSLTLSGLQASTPYHFQLTAQDACARQVVSADVPFTTLAAPDLQVVQVAEPTNVWTGAGFLVSWVDTNSGLGVAAGPWVDKVYLSFTNKLNTQTDVLLGSFTFSGPLNSGQGAQLTQLVTLSETGITNGFYYISVVADAGNAVYEVTKTNNVGVSATNLYVNQTPLPALAVTAVNAPTNALGGQPVTVGWTVCNLGNGATDVPLWYDHLYLSTSTNLGNAISDYGTFANPGYLTPGNCYEQSATVNLPVGVSGNYYFIVKTDATGLLTQGTTANNVGITVYPITVQLVTPGFLHVASVQVSPAPPTAVWAGDTVNVTWTVENIGQSSITSTWDDEVTLSPTPVYDFVHGYWDVINHIYFTGPLAPGQSYTHSEPFTVPLGIAPGNWYVVPVVNTHHFAGGNGSIGSGSIGNDQMSTLVLVSPPPPSDLVMTSVIAPTNTVAGQTINVQWTVDNEGNYQSSSSSWYDGVYLSTNPVFNLSQSILLGTAAHFGVLALGAAYTNTLSVGIPTNLVAAGASSATNYVFAVADVGDAVVEVTKSNNILGAPNSLVIVPAEPADLVVTQVQAPGAGGLGAGASIGTLVAGSTALISWTVMNQGAGTTSVSNWTDSIYLSPSSSLNPTTEIHLADILHTGFLAPGGAYSQRQSVPLPSCYNGNYYFVVVADRAVQVNGDGAVSNHVLATTAPSFIWPSQAAHLEVTSVTPPASAQAGSSLPVTWTVQNLGNATTNAPWVDALYLSPTPQWVAGSAYLLGTYPHAAQLGAQASYQQSQSPEILPCISGSFYVAVATDVGEVVNGLVCYTNNLLISAAPVKIQPASYASLQVSGLQAPLTVTSGIPSTVAWFVTNSGPSAAVGPWTDAIYVSTLATLDTNALLLGLVTHTNGLAAGGTYARTNSFALPPCVSGNFNLLVVADVSNVVNVAACLNSGQDFALVPLTVNYGLHPELIVTALTNSATATAGQPFNLSWSVTNNGVGTAMGPWVDSVYLSSSLVFNPTNSVLLGTYSQSATIPAGAGYTASTSFLLPNTYGTFYVVVVLDSGGAVQQCLPAADNINYGLTTVTVPATLYPDLKVTSVTVPASAYSGQSINVTWVVTNEGTAATPAPNWLDALFLSLEQLLNVNDVALGTFTARSGLAVGQSYTNTATVVIPTGLAGPYYVLGLADSGSALFEHLGYNDSLGWNANPMVVVLPPPADLVATSATVSPPNALPGTSLTITWNVQNNSTNSIPATWTDAIYLSTNTVWDLTAVPLASVNHSGLAANAGYTGSWTGPLPALTPGTYYAIVRTDVRDTVNELTLSNNAATSPSTVSVDVPVLTLGQPVTNLLSTGAAQYYKFSPPAGDTIKITMTGSVTNAANELFARFGAVPDLGDYDYLYNNPLSADQQVLIPTTASGWYYVMVRGGNEPNGPLTYTLEADIVPFAITSISANQIGDNGQVTLTFNGAKFEPGATVQLVSGTNVYAAATNMFGNPTYVTARFLFTNAVDGLYDVVLTNPDRTSTRDSQAITIEPAIALTTEVIPGLVNNRERIGLPFVWNGVVVNVGNVDIQYLTVNVNDAPGFPIALTPPPQAIYAVTNSTANSGNACLFLTRDLPVGAAYPFSFVISGFDGSGFYYYATSTVQSKQDFLQELANLAEISRLYLLTTTNSLNVVTTNTSGVLSTNLASIPNLIGGSLVDSQTWASFFAQGFVATGILDTNENLALPPPTVTSVNDFLTNSSQLSKDACSDCWALYDAAQQAALEQFAITTAACGVACFLPPFWPCVVCEAAADLILLSQEKLNNKNLDICLAANCPPPPPPCAGKVAASEVLARNVLSKQGIGPGPGGPGGGGCSGPDCPSPNKDPNELVGPAGFGTAALVGVQTPWPYTIYFASTTNSVAFVRQITITNTLDPSLDIRTFRVSQVAYGDVTISVPTNRSFLQFRAPAPSPNPTNIVVDVTVGVDVVNNDIFCTMNAIDLNTGQLVVSPDEGILPPDTTNNIGQGNLTYSILPKARVTTGTVVTNEATIVFDINAPLNTNPTTNTVDAVPPTSSMAVLPTVQLTTNFVLAWSGTDDPAGSGVATYDIYFNDNSGPWQILALGETTNTTSFGGLAGHTYGFYSLAHDNAGNVEQKSPRVEAYTFISSNQPPILSAITNQLLAVGSASRVLNVATNPAGAAQLTYSLLDAPLGADINRTNGTIYWTPNPAQAGTTNLFTVQVSNNGIPPLSASVSFVAIVGDYAALGLGSGGVLAGQSVCVPLTLVSSAGLTNLNFTLTYPAAQLGELSLTPSLGQLTVRTVPVDSSHAQITVQTVGGSALVGTQQVASVCFTGMTNQQSGVATVSMNFANATELNGSMPATLAATPGTIVVLQGHPYLTVSPASGGQVGLTLYGTPGSTNVLQSSSSLTGPWTAVETIILTGVSQPVAVTNSAPNIMFFRLVRQ